MENQLIEYRFTEVKEKLEEILEQTKRTNGRVSSLEVWRGYTTGAIAVILIAIPVIIRMIK